MPDRVPAAILLKLGSVACLTALAACVHASAAEGVPVGQIMAFRAGVSLLLILAWGLATVPPRALMPKRLKPHIMRGTLACTAMALTYVAFAKLPIAQAQVLGYLAPILVLPIAATTLGERLTPGLLAAMGVALAGVVLILGVSLELGPDATVGALCGLAAAGMVAAIQVLIRQMTATETTLSIAMSFSVIVTAASLASALLGDWVLPSAAALATLVAAGVFGAATLVLNTEAISRAPVSRLAPFEFCGLVFALILDLALFGHLPGLAAAAGSILVTGAAIWVTLRGAGLPRPAERGIPQGSTDGGAR